MQIEELTPGCTKGKKEKEKEKEREEAIICSSYRLLY